MSKQKDVDKRIEGIFDALKKREALTYKMLTVKTPLSRQFAAISYLNNERRLYKRLTHPKIVLAVRWLDSEVDEVRIAHLKRIKHHQIQMTLMARKVHTAKIKQFAKTLEDYGMAKEIGNYNYVVGSFNKLLQEARGAGNIKARARRMNTAYDALMDEYDPGRDIDNFEHMVKDLQNWVPSFLASQQKRPEPTPRPLPHIPKYVQKKLCQDILLHMGVHFSTTDFEEGVHPTCFGTRGNVLITMCFDEQHFITAAMDTVHEGGHALLRQNTPAKFAHGPAGEVNSQTTDEAVALLMENTLGRSAGFAEFLSKTLRDKYGYNDPALSPENLLLHLKSQAPAALEQKPSSRALYPLHIALRYKMGRKLIDGGLNARDLPTEWEKAHRELLGNPKNPTIKDVLKDVHWYGGRIGYFPCYFSGTMMAAQLFDKAVKDDPRIKIAVDSFNPEPLLKWMQANVFDIYPFYTSEELTKKVTGTPLSTSAFKQSLTPKITPPKPPPPRQGFAP